MNLYRLHFKRITALVLAAALILGMDGGAFNCVAYAALNTEIKETSSEVPSGIDEEAASNSEAVDANATYEGIVEEKVEENSEADAADEVISEEVAGEIIEEAGSDEVIEQADEEEIMDEDLSAGDAEADALTGTVEDGDEYVQFSNPALFAYLATYYASAYGQQKGADIDYPGWRQYKPIYDEAMTQKIVEGTSNRPDNYGTVKKSDLSAITSIIIKDIGWVAGDNYIDEKSTLGYASLKFTDFDLFPNLKKVEIHHINTGNTEGYPKIEGIEFSPSIDTVIIDGCTLTSDIDFSSCSNLKSLIFTNNKFIIRDHYTWDCNGRMKNLDTIKTLTNLQLNGSEVTEIGLFSGSDPVPDISVDAKNCTKMTNFDSGSYRLKSYNNYSFKGCSSLTTARIKGICDGDGQILNISGCQKLNNLDIEYAFSDDTKVIKINAEGTGYLNADDTYDISIGRIGGSPAGKIDIAAFKETSLSAYLNSLADGKKNELYSNIDIQDLTPAFIVFDQDKSKFEENEGWKKRIQYDGDTGIPVTDQYGNVCYKGIRNYNLNPLQLRVGETIRTGCYNSKGIHYPGVIEETPHFYTANGIEIPSDKVKYEATYTDILKPTNEEIQNKGFSGLNYWVVNKSGDTVKSPNWGLVLAKNPGRTKVEVIAKDKDGNVIKDKNGEVVKAIRIINVYNFVESIEFTSDDKPVFYGKEDKAVLGTVKYNTKYPSLNDDGLVNPYLSLGILAGDTSTSPAGLKVYTDSAVYKEEGGYKIPYQSVITDLDNSGDTGTYKLKVDTYEKSEGKYDAATNSYSCDSTGISVEKEFSTVNIKTEGGTLAYGIGLYKQKVGEQYAAGFEDAVYLSLPPVSENYKIGEFRIGFKNENGSVNVDNDCVLTEYDEANRRYKFTFTDGNGANKGNLSKNVAQFLYSFGTNAAKLIASVDLLDKNDKLIKTLSKEWEMQGCFSVDYYTYDGTKITTTNNYDSIYVAPSIYRNLRLTTPTRPGYDSLGWFADSENESLPVDSLGAYGGLGDLKLTAHYTPTVYKIEYDLGKGAVSNNPLNPATYTIESDTITLKAPTKEEATFEGWYLSKDGLNPVTEIKKGSTGNIKLFARWKTNPAHYHTIVIDDYVAPTCESKGKSSGSSCSVCGEVVMPQKDIPALGHRLDSGTITKEATIDTAGVMTYRCSRNGCNYKEEVRIPSISEAGDVITEDTKILDNPDITDTTISVTGVKNAEYTGKAITFDLRVYAGKTLLKEGTDYTIKYVNNKNVPSADAADNKKPAIIITGKGQYKDNKTYDFKPIYFTITPVDISRLEDSEDAVVSNAVVLAAKKSKLIKPVPTITIDGKKLNKKDYTVSYGEGRENGIDSAVTGKYDITLTGTGNYCGSVISTYEIVEDAPLLSAAKVTGIKKNLSYADGAAIKQADYKVSTKIDKANVELTEGSDYLVRYVDNREVGTASMIIFAKPGNEKGLLGEKVITFKISGTPLNKLTYEYAKSVDYTGSSIRPGAIGQSELKVTDRKTEKELVYGIDYEVAYSKNVQAGTAVMQISGIGLYSGTIKKTFKIKAVDLSKAEGVNASLVPGSVKKETEGKLKDKYSAQVTVVYNQRLLKEGKDYTISYKNNAKPGSKDDGKLAPQVIIKGKGNFAKTISVGFDITE